MIYWCNVHMHRGLPERQVKLGRRTLRDLLRPNDRLEIWSVAPMHGIAQGFGIMQIGPQRLRCEWLWGEQVEKVDVECESECFSYKR